MKHKQTFQSILALLLAACLTLAVTACGTKRPSLAGISLAKHITLTAGERQALEPQYVFEPGLDAASQQEAVRQLNASFTSTNTQVASVSATGEVLALSQGDADIQLSVGNITASTTVTVLPKLEALATADHIQLTEGERTTLAVTAQPAGAVLDELSFSSSDTSVVTASSTGILTAIACGEATITAQCGDVTRQIPVTVSHRIESIVFDQAEGSLIVGETAQLSPIIAPEDTELPLVWSCDNAAIATVQEGLVTALAPGEAVIRATIAEQEDLYAEYRLSVQAVTGSTGTSAGGRTGNSSTGGSNTPAAGSAGQSANSRGQEASQPGYTPGGAGDPNYFYCEICTTYHRKGVLAACGRGHSTVGTDCTWVLRDAYAATCWENRLEIYDCASNCGMCWVKTIENSTIPCEFTRLIDAFEDGAIVQKYCCHMCGAMAP